MSDTQDIFKQGLDRMNALIGYWANVPLYNPISGGAAQLSHLASTAQDLQQIFGEAYRRHLGPFVSENQKVIERFTALMHSSDPRELDEFRLELLRVMMEGAAVRAEIWGDLASRLGHRYAEFAREYAQSLPATPSEAAGKRPVVAKAA
jgi:hypothetical protein